MRVKVDVKPATIAEDETVSCDWARETAPGVTVIVGSALVIALPAMVAEIVLAVPDVVPVKLAV